MMKVTSPEVIKESESELLSAIRDNLDQSALEELLRDRIDVSRIDLVQGDIVPLGDQVAYQLDLEIKVHFRVLLDRSGKWLSVSPEDSEAGVPGETGEEQAPATGLPMPEFDLPEPDLHGLPDPEMVVSGAIGSGEDLLAEGPEEELATVLEQNRGFWADRKRKAGIS